MKHNWEYKRLGDICTVNFGKRIVAKDTTPGPYKVYGGGGATFTTLNFNRENCTIVSRFAMSSNCVRFVKGKFFLNDSGLTIETKIDYLTQGFIDKFLWVNQPLIFGLGRGMAQKNLNVKALLEINVPVPPMEVQEQIVAELDKINETIEDCRELLRNLDDLAQSLFYDFFGDPITNSKGWEIKPLKDAVIEMFLGPFGSALKTDCYVPEEDSFAMVYEQKHAIKKTLAQENNFINEDKFFALKRFEVLPFDFIMSCRGTIGQLYQVPENAPRGIIHPSVMKIRLNSSTYGSVFFKFLLPIIIKEQQTKGNCVQMAITAKELGAKKLPVPPFSLQEKFAERIEQIEAQKKAVESTIAELQTLLDSRMDYWFN